MKDSKGRDLKPGDKVILFAEVLETQFADDLAWVRVSDGVTPRRALVATSMLARNNDGDINLLDPEPSPA